MGSCGPFLSLFFGQNDLPFLLENDRAPRLSVRAPQTAFHRPPVFLLRLRQIGPPSGRGFVTPVRQIFREVQKSHLTPLSLWAKVDRQAAWTSGLDRTPAPGSSYGPPQSPSFSQPYHRPIIQTNSHVIQSHRDCPELAPVTGFTSILANHANDQKRINIIKDQQNPFAR
jgi:hypothetical protein